MEELQRPVPVGSARKDAVGLGRVLFVANDSEYFRAHWYQRALAARAAGYEVHLAMPPGPAVEVLERADFSVHLFPVSRQGRNPLAETKSLFSLVRLYRKLRPDLVHHLTIKPVLYGGIAARLTKVPAVVSAITGLGYVFGHADGKGMLLKRLVLMLYRFALGHKRLRVTFENRADRELFVRHGLVTQSNSVWIRGAGVDMNQFIPSPEPSGPPVVILPARLLWDKGVGELVEAAQRLRAEGSAARFALVGDSDSGNPSAVPRAQLEQWKSKGPVEWWGRRSDMPAVYRSVHIVCLPTCYPEGIPRTLIEAAACARPVVATDIAGCREVVQEGVNGLLVPIRNVDALASALRRLINDAALRREMGAHGRKIVESDFSTESVAQQTLSLYQDLLAG